MKVGPGHVAVVTGGASGIGLALVRQFAARGAKVVVGDVEASALDATVSSLRAEGVDTIGFRCDVSDLEQVRALRAASVDAYGQVDVICNNAGIFAGLAPMWELSYGDWRWNVDVNLWGVIHGIMTFVPDLVERNAGLVVNTASSAGISIVPFNAPYNAAKHAVVALTETLRAELDVLAPGVATSVICPGRVATRVGESARNRPTELGAGSPHAFGASIVDPAAVTERQRLIAASLRPPGPDAGVVLDPDELARLVMADLDAGRLHIAPGEGVRFHARRRVERLLEDLED